MAPLTSYAGAVVAAATLPAPDGAVTACAGATAVPSSTATVRIVQAAPRPPHSLFIDFPRAQSRARGAPRPAHSSPDCGVSHLKAGGLGGGRLTRFVEPAPPSPRGELEPGEVAGEAGLHLHRGVGAYPFEEGCVRRL